MKLNALALASALSDEDLLAHLAALASREREATADLVAHLAALDARPSLFAAEGYSSLFAYCTQRLGFSEDAACNRIDAARGARRFPVVLDLLASGELTLTSIRLLGKYLTPENHHAVLARASRMGRRQLEALVAELAPRPDVPASVRKLPTPATAVSMPSRTTSTGSTEHSAGRTTASEATAPSVAVPSPVPQARPIVQATSPARYRVQFTMGQESHDRLRRLQDLLRHQIPDGDVATIFDRAVASLLKQVETRKLGATTSIRRRTDKVHISTLHSRHVPHAVRRAVWQRDGGQCAFVSAAGHRCAERGFLEYHHVIPHALRGPATVEKIALRCRRHNAYEAQVVFGAFRQGVETTGAS